MLSIFLFHLLISVVCLLAGFLFLTCLNKLCRQKELYRPIAVYLITGIVAIAAMSQCLVVFFPLNFYTTTFLWLILLAGGLLFRKSLALYIAYLFSKLSVCNRLKIAIMLSAWLMILVISAGPLIMDDTGSYHIQIIKWTQEYGTVKGLANLHERFGFNSAWLTLVSVFTPANPGHNYYTSFNSLLSVWLTGYLLSSFFDDTRTTHRTGILVILLYALVCWPLLRGNAATANYDFITTVVVVVLFMEVWKCRNGDHPGQYPLTEMLLWPVFLFTVRIINWPLLFISLFAVLQLFHRKQLSLLYCCSSICFVLFLVLLVRNVLLSGYLFYPISQIDLFSFDWKADPADARRIVSFIRYFNRVPSLPTEEASKLTGFRWLPVWFNDLQWYDKSIVITCLAGFSLQATRYRKLVQDNAALACLLLVFAFQLLSWLLIAPDTRFAYGPLLAGSYMLAATLKIPMAKSVTTTVGKIAPAMLGIIMLLYSSIKVFIHREYRNPLIPVSLPVPPVHTEMLSGITVYIPGKVDGNWNARCYGTCLPCLYTIKPGLRARSNDIKDGFKIEQ
jgi:hypothetical protein